MVDKDTRWNTIRGSITHEEHDVLGSVQKFAVIRLAARVADGHMVALQVKVPQAMWANNAKRHLDWAARDLASRGVIL